MSLTFRLGPRISGSFWVNMDITAPDAVVIEPDGNLAEALTDILASWGFHATAFATHGAALDHAAGLNFIDLLAACVPASDDDRAGAYLADARSRQGGLLSTVLMLSDHSAADGHQPPHAVEVLKPFIPTELRTAIKNAGVILPASFLDR